MDTGKKRWLNFYLKLEEKFMNLITGVISMRFLTWIAITLMTKYGYIELTGMEYVLATTALVVSGVYKQIKKYESGMIE